MAAAVFIISYVIIVLAVINISGSLKKKLDNDERIIEKLDILIDTLKDKGKVE